MEPAGQGHGRCQSSPGGGRKDGGSRGQRVGKLLLLTALGGRAGRADSRAVGGAPLRVESAPAFILFLKNSPPPLS